MVEVTLRFDSVGAMLAYFMPPPTISSASGSVPPTISCAPGSVTVVNPLAEPAASPKKAARKKAEVTAGAAKVAEALNAAVPPAKAAPLIVGVEAVEKALDRLFDAKGIEVAREVMAGFGVKRGRELKPEQYAAFVTKCDSLLAEVA